MNHNDSLELANLLISEIEESLDERLSDILLIRLGIYDGDYHTLAEIGKKYHLSRERIRQLLDKAIQKIKFRANYLIRKADPDHPSLILYNYFNDELNLNEIIQMSEDSFSFLNQQNFLWFVYKITDIKKYKLISNEINEAIAEKKSKQNSEIRMKNLINKVMWPIKIINANDLNRDQLTPKRQISIQENCGIFNSDKMQKDIFYESMLELKFIYDIENSSMVSEYYFQPFKIKYFFEYTRFYYPDFLLILKNGNCVVVEIKGTDQLGTIANRVKFESLIEFCNKNGLGCLITNRYITIKDILENLLDEEFEKEILDILKIQAIDWISYKIIKQKYNTDLFDFLSLIYKNNLHFSIKPFKLKLRD